LDRLRGGGGRDVLEAAPDRLGRPSVGRGGRRRGGAPLRRGALAAQGDERRGRRDRGERGGARERGRGERLTAERRERCGEAERERGDAAGEEPHEDLGLDLAQPAAKLASHRVVRGN